MNIILTGVIAGVLGTLAMDLLNHFFGRLGLITKIDMATVSRVTTGWTHGRLCYEHPGEMKQVDNEVFYGYISHYIIGISLALPFVFGWNLLVGGPSSAMWALIYGVGTTIASWFFVYPSIGLGVFGWKSPDGIKAALSSLANHLFYGIGFAVSIALL